MERSPTSIPSESSLLHKAFVVRFTSSVWFVGYVLRVHKMLILRLAKWYPVSKTLAEKAAWEFAEKNGLDVVAINPATCLGQLLQPGLNASCAVLQQLLQGSTDTQEYHWLGAVHVKDVAAAQILLFESPRASGRYLCTNGIYQFGDFADRVSKLFPEFSVHRFTGETQPGLVACKDAAKKLIDLGLIFTPVEDAVKDTVNSLKAKGLIN
ncbi:hypothetical protein RDI58_002982 [Solanum bulbocastanum]|uniref:NAD-dependent epimerase/dehydratase domain-containing protein n=1 Tax=Solanum bulbocastanum TaxID=147425 RepID=A0AAN8UGU7_SOLBU